MTASSLAAPASVASHRRVSARAMRRRAMPLAAITFYLGTTELTFPLGLPEEVGLAGRLFAEGGALFDVDDNGAGIQE